MDSIIDWFDKMIAKIAAKLWYKYRRQFQLECGALVLKDVKQKGIDCRIKGPMFISLADCLELGDYVRIGNGCFFFCMGGLKIGDNTQISRNVTIYTANHDIDSDAIPYNDTYKNKPVVIGRHVWIGMDVRITPGVTIGDGATIGMGTVVSKDVPPGAVVVGAPQRIVKYRNMEKFEQIDKEERYFGKIWPNH